MTFILLQRMLRVFGSDDCGTSLWTAGAFRRCSAPQRKRGEHIAMKSNIVRKTKVSCLGNGSCSTRCFMPAPEPPAGCACDQNQAYRLSVMLSHLDVGFTDSARYLGQRTSSGDTLLAVTPELRSRCGQQTTSRPKGFTGPANRSCFSHSPGWPHCTLPERRQRKLVQAVEIGQVDVAAMPFNTLPMENADRKSNRLWSLGHSRSYGSTDASGDTQVKATVLAGCRARV